MTEVNFKISQNLKEELLRYLYKRLKDTKTLKLIFHFQDINHKSFTKEIIINDVKTICTTENITFVREFKFEITTDDSGYLQKVEVFSENEKIVEHIGIMRYFEKGVTLASNGDNLFITID